MRIAAIGAGERIAADLFYLLRVAARCLYIFSLRSIFFCLGRTCFIRATRKTEKEFSFRKKFGLGSMARVVGGTCFRASQAFDRGGRQMGTRGSTSLREL